MRQKVIALACLVVITLTGVIHGVLTDRWQAAPELTRSLAALDRVPISIGNWDGQSIEMPKAILKAADIAGYFACQYTNRETGQSVSVLVVCGLAGPISVHPPDVCYQGQGFSLARPPEKKVIEADSLEFQHAKFQKSEGGVLKALSVLWAWSPSGKWLAPANPRVTYARQHALYKLYVVRDVAATTENAASDPSLEFIHEFLPELNRVLFATPEG
jgi:hypothetical protein